MKALSVLRSGGDPDEAQRCFDAALEKWELGGANAERAFSALVWAHALHEAGHAGRAHRWVDLAQSTASRHGFDLARCEHGAAALIR